MSERDVLVEVKKLKKYYPYKKKTLFGKKSYLTAVDEVDFELGRYQSVGVVGESGCGKSTLGKTILALTKPTAGKVVFNGITIFDAERKEFLKKKEMDALRKDMQIIFQDPYSSLDPKYTIGQTIEEGVIYHRIVCRNETVQYCKEMLESCGLKKEMYYSYPHELSGGQRQRAVIARAMALHPKFIVCDEPTAALDVSIQAQILDLMMEKKREWGLTYLFISHNLKVTRAFCDEIVVMYKGRIIEKGEAVDVCDRPLHPYTKMLIASLPASHPGERKERLEARETCSEPGIAEGCRFYSRCPHAFLRCREERPELREIEKGRWVACLLFRA